MKPMKKTYACIALLISLLALGQDRAQKIDSLLTHLYRAGQINGNFLIAEKGQVLYQKSFGLANEEKGEPLNAEAVFEIASVSKQFTAMATMILCEKGKLGLDDGLSKFIPELSFYRGITIRNLLNHTSGLPDYMELFEKVFDPSKIATNKDVITIFAQHRPKLLFAPNTKHEYCNTGYALLATVIERVSGETFPDFLQKSIFEPLGMTHTLVYKRRLAPKRIDHYAFGYVYSETLKKYVLPDDQDGTKYVVMLDGVVGDGGVNATVQDLLKWDRALYAHTLLSKKSTDDMFRATTLTDSTSVGYGFGWQIEDHPEFGKIVYHGGGWPGYATFFARHLTDDKTIIILQNHDDITLPLQAIRSILYNKPEANGLSLTPKELQKFEGSYELQPGMVINIEQRNGQLYAKTAGQPTLELIAESATSFRLKEINALIEFAANAETTVSGFTFSQGAMKTVAKKIN